MNSTPTPGVWRASQVQDGLLTALELSPEVLGAELHVSEGLIDSLRNVANRWVAYQRNSSAIDFTAAEQLLRKNQSRRRYWLECFREGRQPVCDYGRPDWVRDYWNAHDEWERQLWNIGYDFDGWEIIGFHGDQARLRSALDSKVRCGEKRLGEFSTVFGQIVEAGPPAVEVAESLIRDGIFDGVHSAKPLDLLAAIGAVLAPSEMAA